MDTVARGIVNGGVGVIIIVLVTVLGVVLIVAYILFYKHEECNLLLLKVCTASHSHDYIVKRTLHSNNTHDTSLQSYSYSIN